MASSRPTGTNLLGQTPSVTLGFTGTQKGLTDRQSRAVYELFKELGLTCLHHGDCIGGDAQAHYHATNCGAAIVVHPPEDERKRAYCAGLRTTILECKDYLERNHDIVAQATDGVIAAPKDYTRPLSLRGQGTWTTLRYAEKANRYIWVVFPDGRIKEGRREAWEK